MILTKEYMRAYGSCAEGYELALRTNHIGRPIDEAIEYCKSIGRFDFASDLEATKKTELYVRSNGKNISMADKYKVFNPLTGQYIECPNIGAAKKALSDVTQQFIEHHGINVSQVISNENGDEAWTPIDAKSWIKINTV